MLTLNPKFRHFLDLNLKMLPFFRLKTENFAIF